MVRRATFVTAAVWALLVVAVLLSVNAAEARPSQGSLDSDGLASGGEGGGASVGECGAEIVGTLAGKRRFKLEVESEDGKLEGVLSFLDQTASVDFRSTAITGLVVDGSVVSVQGVGKTKSIRSLGFSVVLDTAARSFGIRLGNGYAASGAFGRDDDVEVSGFCPFDGSASLVLQAAGEVSGTVGRAGGSLAAGGMTLTVPAGALSGDVVIRMTPISDLADSPLQGLLFGGVKLEPEGLVFLKPVSLTVPLPAGVSGGEVRGFGSAGDGSDLHLQPRTVSGGAVRLELWHFSTGGAFGGGSAAAAVQTRRPSTAERQALQRIAAAEPACEVEEAQGIFGGAACDNLRQESVRALFDWYTTAVRPGLVGAATALSPQAEAALAEWLAWMAQVVLVFYDDPQGTPQCGTLQNECDRAHELATTAVAGHVQRRLGNCTGTSLVSQLRDVARMADFAGAGAIVLPAPLPDPTGGALLHECAHLKIEVTEFPLIAALQHANTLRGKVTVDVYTGPDRTDVPFTLTVGGATVATDADGSFQTTVTTTGTPLDVRMEAEATNPTLQFTFFTADEPLRRPARQRLQIIAQGPTTVAAGGTVGLLVRVAGDGMAGNVALTVGGLGSVSPSPVATNGQGEATAVYTAPSSAVNPNAQVIATLPDGTTASVPITIAAAITVSLDPASAALSPGGTRNFTATVANSLLGVTWSATGGAIVGTGSHTARYDAGSTPGTFTVTATSIADPTKSASATVTISAAGQITVLSRQSTVTAGCGVEHGLPGDCLGADGFSEAIGPFSFTATDAVTGTIELIADFPGFAEQASATATQSSDAQLNVLFPLLVDFSGTVTATATATAGVNQDPSGGGVARAGAFAGGSSTFEVQFEVSGAAVPFELFGAGTVSGSGCVTVNLERLSASGDEFEADFCAGEPPQSLNDSGFLAPGRYTLDVEISAGAVMQSDRGSDGSIYSDGIGAGSGGLDFSLIVG